MSALVTLENATALETEKALRRMVVHDIVDANAVTPVPTSWESQPEPFWL